MTIQRIFESLDSAVFTPELKNTLSEKFDSAVEERALIKAQVIADELLESKIDDLDEKATAYGEYLLNESVAKQDAFKQDITEKLTEYMDLVVKEFVADAKGALDESLKSEQSDMLIEAFDSLLIAGGVEIAQIVEAKEAKELNESAVTSDRVNKLVEEVIQLKEANTELLKMGIIKELSEGLTLVQADRFARLAKMVDFQGTEQCVEKLETLLESMSDEPHQPTQEAQAITESKSAWSHLI